MQHEAKLKDNIKKLTNDQDNFVNNVKSNRRVVQNFNNISKSPFTFFLPFLFLFLGKNGEMKIQNQKLLNRLVDIQNGKFLSVEPVAKKKKKGISQSVNNLNSKKSDIGLTKLKAQHSLNNYKRKQEDQRIALENTKLVKRIY